DRGQLAGCEHRQSDTAGEPDRMRGLRALEIGVLEFLEDDRMAARPGLAGQAFVEAEAHLLARRAKLAERTVQPIEESQLLAVRRRHPDFRNPHEGLHGVLRGERWRLQA